MKIIEVREFGATDKMHLVERPTPQPGPNQILVENKASGINFADVMSVSGAYPGIRSAPFDPGFEVAGVVCEVGPGVDGFHIGDRVMGLPRRGGYASHAILEAPTVVKLPPELDFAPATALLIQGLTAYFLLETAPLNAGDTVLIPSAAGGVGSLALQIARIRGAGKIIGLASPSKHDLVRELGAEPVDYTQPGWSQAVMEATGGKGVDVFLDSQGDLSGEGTKTFAEKARWMLFGSQAGGGGALDVEALIFRNVSLRGYTLYGDMAAVPRALPEILNWVSSGQLKVRSDHRFKLEDARDAHKAILARQTSGKVVLEP